MPGHNRGLPSQSLAFSTASERFTFVVLAIPPCDEPVLRVGIYGVPVGLEMEATPARLFAAQKACMRSDRLGETKAKTKEGCPGGVARAYRLASRFPG